MDNENIPTAKLFEETFKLKTISFLIYKILKIIEDKLFMMIVNYAIHKTLI